MMSDRYEDFDEEHWRMLGELFIELVHRLNNLKIRVEV
jgi:hypothetical protein